MRGSIPGLTVGDHALHAPPAVMGHRMEMRLGLSVEAAVFLVPHAVTMCGMGMR